MKKSLLIGMVVTSALLNNLLKAQTSTGNVGINTTEPAQKLHVSGTSSTLVTNVGTSGLSLIGPTVRVDGLNQANNTSVFSSSNAVNPLYVDASGNTIAVPSERRFSYIIPGGGDQITSSVILNVTGNQQYQVTSPLISVTFTLDRRSMVFISSVVSARVSTQNNTLISDGKARSVLAILRYTQATSNAVTLNSTFSSSGFTYVNGTSTGNLLTEKLNATSEGVLPAGTYTIEVRGAGIAAIDDDFRVTFGDGNNDKLNIIAKPL